MTGRQAPMKVRSPVTGNDHAAPATGVGEGQPRNTIAGNGDAGGRDEGDASSHEARRNREVEALVGIAQRRVEPSQRAEHRPAHEHGTDVGAQHIGDAIALALIEVTRGEFDRGAGAGHAHTQRHDPLGAVDTDELGRHERERG
ncbi:hypothetical protein IT882_03780 [Microbacterium schleiferi]|uniref:Uncharacterized protein n=1 Tax=Microbacterium schleiferi TaxID=69362 RepID=A0A7S8MXV6_9MICO|nr:hypothetical protein [Microbacterium schleiferi]QPE05214.1 hypothetical protein IT882_03780 [Microbacterium schleiferi]